MQKTGCLVLFLFLLFLFFYFFCPVFKYPLDVAKGLWENEYSGLSKASELLNSSLKET